MSKETPCLPGCRCNCGNYAGEHHLVWRGYPHNFTAESHAPACPNAPKAEAEGCSIPGCSGDGSWARPHNGDVHLKAQAPPKLKVKHGVNCSCAHKKMCEDLEEAEAKRKPAPPAPVGDIKDNGFGRLTMLPAPPAPKCEPPEELFNRISEAIRRVCNGNGTMRIPADSTDPDLVLADCRLALFALKAQNAELVYSRDKALRIADENANASQVACSGWDRAKAEVAKLKAQNATLTERVQAAERDSSASMELYRSAVARRDGAEAKVATLTAEVERLMDLIVGAFETGTGHGALQTEAQAIQAARAAREAGKTV